MASDYRVDIEGLPSGLKISFTCKTAKEVFDELSFWQALPTHCPITAEPARLIVTRGKNGKGLEVLYYAMVSGPYTQPVGQKMGGDVLFANPGKWFRYDKSVNVNFVIWNNDAPVTTPTWKDKESQNDVKGKQYILPYTGKLPDWTYEFWPEAWQKQNPNKQPPLILHVKKTMADVNFDDGTPVEVEQEPTDAEVKAYANADLKQAVATTTAQASTVALPTATAEEAFGPDKNAGQKPGPVAQGETKDQVYAAAIKLGVYASLDEANETWQALYHNANPKPSSAPEMMNIFKIHTLTKYALLVGAYDSMEDAENAWEMVSSSKNLDIKDYAAMSDPYKAHIKARKAVKDKNGK